jgi:hypothetical protein
MPASEKEPKFTAEEAQRFASLMAGGDTLNPSEAEAVGKLRMMRRMAVAKGLRLVDAWELPEIRHAIDNQSQPVRATNADAAIKAEVEALRSKLARVVPKVRELTEALTREKELTAKLRGHSQARQNQHATAGNGASNGAAADSEIQTWLLEAALVIAALVLIVMAAFR